MSQRPILLGFTVSDDLAAEIFALDPLPAVQTHRFAWSLARSLRLAFGRVELVSVVPIQSWPLANRLFFPRRRFEQDGVPGVLLAFINAIGIKHISRFFSALVEFTRRIRHGTTEIVVFIHGVHTPWLAIGRILRVFGARVFIVLTDPAGVVLPTDGNISRALKRLDRSLVGYFVSRASGVLALAPDLALVHPDARRRLVFPGILNGRWLAQLDAARATDRAVPDGVRPVTVLYAGTVNASYGVDLLVQAARLLPDIRFRILGKGDMVDRLRQEAAENVAYEGFVSPDALADHLLDADILINPRPSAADFARNSFPSKLLEYASTGRPVLTTRIASIPDALSACFHYIEDETPQGMADAIRTLATLPVTEQLVIARKSRETVLAECSEAAIGKKLQNFIGASE